ncbi:hypothetical protein ACI6QG_07930 [Roseococcus sp. DSY-14]|uniref:hypothetical protein n=1 Tax=Roseococcus sp. DSY-14 TaxID=3369650 RepID=UPI00387AA158
MIRPALLLLPLLLAAPAQAQVRDFSCVGAEQLEGVVLEFPQGRDRAGLDALAPLVERAKAEQALNLCVLGFAGAGEGGAETASRLAARRARFVAQELAKQGVERDRIRAEARTRGFLDPARRGGEGGVRRAPGVRVVLMPVAG